MYFCECMRMINSYLYNSVISASVTGFGERSGEGSEHGSGGCIGLLQKRTR